MLQPQSVDQNTEVLVALAKRLFPDVDFAREAPAWKAVRILALALTDGQMHARRAANANSVLYALGDEQDNLHGKIYNLPRKAATGARKAAALRVVGTVGATVPADAPLTHTSGLRYATQGTATISALGYVDVGVYAVDVGSATRLSKGELLQFDATPVGLEDMAELQVALDEDGEDAEQDGAYGARLLAHTQDPPMGGNAADYREWATRQTGIVAAYVYPVRRGLGTVDVAALHTGRGTARLLNAGEVADLQAYLDEVHPLTHDVRVLTVEAAPQDVELLVVDTGAAEYRADWDDSTPGLVDTWNGTTRTLTFTARPLTLKAGDRVIIKTAGGTGQPVRVETLLAGEAVILEEAPVVAPTTGDLVYAGGSLTDAIRAAVLTHFDGLGTANPDLKAYGTWEGSLRPSALQRLATSHPGCKDADVVAPATVVDAADRAWPLDGVVEVLTPGRVIVRWKR